MTPADPRAAIAVAPAAALAARPRLLGALEDLLPVRFVADGADPAPAGRIVFGTLAEDGDAAAAVPAFVVRRRPGARRRARRRHARRRRRCRPPPARRDAARPPRRAGARGPRPTTRPGHRRRRRRRGARSAGAVPVDRVACALPELGRDSSLRLALRPRDRGRRAARSSCARVGDAPLASRRRCAPRSSSTTPTCAGPATASSTTPRSPRTPTSTATTPRWR